MKHFLYFSIIRGIGYLLVLTLCVNCKKDYNSTDLSQSSAESISEIAVDNVVASQTRTATFLNNLNNFRTVFGDQGYPKAKAEDVSADDDIYAATRKLTAASRTRNNANASSSLALQGFGFTIPENATIQNISVKVRRFKTGALPIKDYLVSVMRRYDCTERNCTYGLMWRNGDAYAGNVYPDIETEYDFLQSGSGNDGGFNHDEAYQWTPAMVNHQFFGVRIDSYRLEGRGSVMVYYDLVEVTVEYSVPEGGTRKSPDAARETKH